MLQEFWLEEFWHKPPKSDIPTGDTQVTMKQVKVISQCQTMEQLSHRYSGTKDTGRDWSGRIRDAELVSSS